MRGVLGFRGFVEAVDLREFVEGGDAGVVGRGVVGFASESGDDFLVADFLGKELGGLFG